MLGCEFSRIVLSGANGLSPAFRPGYLYAASQTSGYSDYEKL